MVIRPDNGKRRSRAGALMIELVVAIAILVAVLIPIGFSLAYEQKLCRAYYYRAVVMELIDGELEVLSAGEWRAFESGKQEYHVEGPTAKKLPPGRFELVMDMPRIQLGWTPAQRSFGGRIERSIVLSGSRVATPDRSGRRGGRAESPE